MQPSIAFDHASLFRSALKGDRPAATLSLSVCIHLPIVSQSANVPFRKPSDLGSACKADSITLYA